MSYRKIKIKQNFYSLSNSYLGSIKSAVLKSNITVLKEGYFYFPLLGVENLMTYNIQLDKSPRQSVILLKIQSLFKIVAPG